MDFLDDLHKHSLINNNVSGTKKVNWAHSVPSIKLYGKVITLQKCLTSLYMIGNIDVHLLSEKTSDLPGQEILDSYVPVIGRHF